MRTEEFSLQPFTTGQPTPPFAISGEITRSGTGLSISYRLTGPLQDLVIAPPAAKPARRWELWEETCLELFLAPRNARHYWEVNLSPAGDWNLFRLSDYRQGIQEELAIQALPFTVRREPGSLTLRLAVELAALISGGQPLDIGISAVLRRQDGGLTFWALRHRGRAPDFHDWQGFGISI